MVECSNKMKKNKKIILKNKAIKTKKKKIIKTKAKKKLIKNKKESLKNKKINNKKLIKRNHLKNKELKNKKKIDLQSNKIQKNKFENLIKKIITKLIEKNKIDGVYTNKIIEKAIPKKHRVPENILIITDILKKNNISILT